MRVRILFKTVIGFNSIRIYRILNSLTRSNLSKNELINLEFENIELNFSSYWFLVISIRLFCRQVITLISSILVNSADKTTLLYVI